MGYSIIMRIGWIIVGALVVSLLCCGCTKIENTGSAAPEVKIERRAFVAQSYSSAQDAVDCSEVIAFINNLNNTLDNGVQISDYDMYYDKDTSTVYVTSDASTLAFKLDANGKITFVSCTGSSDVKSAISQGIAKTYSSSFSKDVDELFKTVDAQIWLNSINAEYVDKAISGFSMDDLDTKLIAKMPDTPELETYDGFPTITEALEKKELMNLDNYFEAPTLEKFWDDIDSSEIGSEVDANKKLGENIKEQFADAEAATPNIEEQNPMPSPSGAVGSFDK